MFLENARATATQAQHDLQVTHLYHLILLFSPILIALYLMG